MDLLGLGSFGGADDPAAQLQQEDVTWEQLERPLEALQESGPYPPLLSRSFEHLLLYCIPRFSHAVFATVLRFADNLMGFVLGRFDTKKGTMTPYRCAVAFQFYKTRVTSLHIHAPHNSAAVSLSDALRCSALRRAAATPPQPLRSTSLSRLLCSKCSASQSSSNSTWRAL
jgi:hypothetical protein